MSGNGFSSGAVAGGVNEYVVGYLERTKGKDWVSKHADIVQWTSITVGSAVNAAIGKDIFTGGSIAEFGTKWNFLKEELIDPNKGIMVVLTPMNPVGGPPAGHIGIIVPMKDGSFSVVEYDSMGQYNFAADLKGEQKGVIRQTDLSDQSALDEYITSKSKKVTIVSYTPEKESIEIHSIASFVNDTMTQSTEVQNGNIIEYLPKHNNYLYEYHLFWNNCTIYVYSALRTILEARDIGMRISPDSLFKSVDNANAALNL